MFWKIFCGASLLLFTGFLCADEKAESAGAKPVEKSAAAVSPSSARDILKNDVHGFQALREFLVVLSIVRQTYIDEEKTGWEYLLKAALRGMLKEMDPYSAYESEEIFRETQVETNGEMAGIGVVVVLKNRILEIMEIYPGGPSDKAGLKPGDLIMEIDGEPLDGKSMKECVKMLRGKPGEKVKVKVYRGSDDSTRDVELTRAILTIHSVTGAKIIDKDSGLAYMRITQFSANTCKEMDSALAQLKKDGMKMLIVDLRNNPGGLVASSAQICSRFLAPGKKIVSIEGRNKKDNKVFVSEKCTNFPDMPVVLLVNGNSASASEIMTACLQDHKRAVVIGEHTFGKGVVQVIIPFGSKEALRITNARYFTPSRRIIHENGIEPDIVVPITNAARFRIAAQMNQYPGIVKPLAPNTIEDIQLKRACDVLKAVSVFQSSRTPESNQK